MLECTNLKYYWIRLCRVSERVKDVKKPTKAGKLEGEVRFYWKMEGKIG